MPNMASQWGTSRLALAMLSVLLVSMFDGPYHWLK